MPHAKVPDASAIPDSVTQNVISRNALLARNQEYAESARAKEKCDVQVPKLTTFSETFNMHQLNHSYTTETTQIRRAINRDKGWIEKSLGVDLSEAVILKTDLAFCDAALPKLIGHTDRDAPVKTAIARLTERLQSVGVPPGNFPIVSLSKRRAVYRGQHHFVGESTKSAAYSMERTDGPMVLRVRDLDFPFVALRIRYHEGPGSSRESVQDVIVVSREGVPSFVSLLKSLTTSDGKPRLQVGSEAEIIQRCDWDQLTLDPVISSLLRDDFESFFAREDWFRKMRLPFRRGYLLHGPPGNGKTSAIRAMLTSRGLTAYTIRFFGEHTDDDDLDQLFRQAADEAPAVVLLEDIDRVFPRTGQSKTKVSLQALLNCLDGVATGEGIITLATANEPTALDPAILRRPGRFDRVVCFPNPTPELRRQYFVNMHPPLGSFNLDEVVEECAGFSFAQLREVFIMAAQIEFGKDREIAVEDLISSIWSLRGTTLVENMKASAGFATPSSSKRNERN